MAAVAVLLKNIVTPAKHRKLERYYGLFLTACSCAGGKGYF